MKTAILTILMVTGFGHFGFAADKTDGKSESFAVHKILCNKSYIPATGVQSPDYQPGVDVNGKPVAPADVQPVVNMVPDFIEVPMTMDLAKDLGILPIGTDIKMSVANLKLYKDGKVEYNGQDISSSAAALCGDAPKNKPSKAEDQPVEPSPQAQKTPDSAAPVVAKPVPAMMPQPDMMRDHVVPIPGSVAPSTTSPEPRPDYQIQKETVNRAQ